MKKYFSYLICLILLSVLIFSSALAAEADPVTIRVGVYDNEPLIFTDENSTVRGIYADLIEYIASEEGWKIEYVHGTWSECLKRLENGEIDVMTAIAYTEERNLLYDFSNENVFTNWGTVYTKPGSSIDSLLDLAHKRVAVLENDIHYVGSRGIINLVEKFDISCTFVEVATYPNVFESIENGSVDAGVVNRMFGTTSEGQYDIVKTSIIFNPIDNMYAFPKNASITPKLIERIDVQMKKLKEDENSIYYQALEEYTGGKVAETFIEIIPEWVKFSLLIGGGVILFLFAVGITSRAQVRQRTSELRESEQRFSLFMDYLPAMVFIKDKESRTLYVNKHMNDVLGAKDWLGKTPLELFPNDIAVTMIADDKKALAEGYQIIVETVPDKNGEDHIYQTHKFSIERSGKTPLLGGIALDITERKRAEERVRFLSSSVEQSSEGMAIADMEGKLTYANQTWAEMHGYESPEELSGKHLSIFHTPEQLKNEVEPFNKMVMENGYHKGEVGHVRNDGTPFPTLMVTTLLKDENGKPIALSGIAKNIADIKMAEEELKKYRDHLEVMVAERTQELQDAQEKIVRQERLAMLGQLAGGVGHELRNPMAVISNAVYYLKMVQPDADEKVKEYLDMIASVTKGAAKIINDLLDFARIKTIDRNSVPVSYLVTETLEKHPAPDNVQVSVEIPDDLPTLFVDPGQIKQVLTNLVTNAYQAMPDEGQLSVSVDQLSVDGEESPQQLLDIGDWLQINIKDNGTGIAPENMDKIFEPLFSTKTKGIGLGLAISRRLVEANGGRIEVESQIGEGTVFRLYLPVYEGKP